MTKMATWESWFVNSYFDYLMHKVVGLDRLLRRAATSAPRSILEVGCGVGITTTLLTGWFPDADIVAIDIDPPQIESAQRRVIKDNVHFFVGDAEHLSFADAKFDACVASYALHHIPAFSRALGEIHRILRPGGSLYILEVPISWEILRLKKLRATLTETQRLGNTPTQLFTRARLLRAIGDAGLSVSFLHGFFHIYLRCERT